MKILLQDLSKRYSAEQTINAVDKVSLEIEQGRFLAIVGRSGSGKSTLLGMLGGISKPSSGTVALDGTNLFSLNANERADFRNEKIGFVFQFASLLPSLRAIDNVALPALIGNTLGERNAYARARSLLQQVGLGNKVDSYPSQLSGGEQRRVAIARALINSPSLLLADEPTADLDETTEKEILDLLVDIHRAFDLTLIVVTHNSEIAEKADQVVEMRSGCATLTRTEAVREPALAGVAARAAETVPHPRSGIGQSGGGMKPEIDPAGTSPTNGDGTVLIVDGARDGKARVKEIYEIPKNVAAKEEVKLGVGIERLLGRCALWMIPVFTICWLVNAGVAAWENNVIQAKADERIALEDLAMTGLRADVKDITLAPGKGYDLSIYLKNTTDGNPLYVMSPSVRAFVQVGGSWQEFSVKPVEENSSRVLKIEGERVLHYILAPEAKDFSQLIPCYMHVRISNDMIVSPRNQPKDDLVDRGDNYYVYLKPHDISDSDILKKLKFPGAPPVWIPMPPH